MAIYPIVKGQRFVEKNPIPPRTPLVSPSKEAHPPVLTADHERLDHHDEPTTAKEPVAMTKEPVDTAPKVHPPLDSSHESTTEIQTLLAATGTVAKEGPLIDFHDDMKKDLPAIKKVDSQDSHDEFVDAQN